MPRQSEPLDLHPTNCGRMVIGPASRGLRLFRPPAMEGHFTPVFVPEQIRAMPGYVGLRHASNEGGWSDVIDPMCKPVYNWQ